MRLIVIVKCDCEEGRDRLATGQTTDENQQL